MFEIIRYTSEKQAEWDAFIAQSKNGTFLMYRGYMDYHSDRFADCSLMFYLKGQLYAVIPANINGHTFHSHQGLTYGGVVMNDKCTASNILHLFEDMNEFLKSIGVKKVEYKPIPHIYSSMPAEEDLYALFRCGASIVARGISTCIDLPIHRKWRQNRRTALNKSVTDGITVEISDDLEDFWNILDTNLMQSHGTHPVHTLNEMRKLKDAFPKNIVLWVAKNPSGNTVAGILLYQTTHVIHSQYISATPEGKKSGAIDAIMHEVLKSENRYFDFGISTEQGGQYLNEKLIFQKEGFGGRGICYDTYEYTLS
ncbi:MAG: GNAT family N-acetyltransferase [Bacteroidaceae bacterium]|nr:GNAT family N-acetyltransferase [Bacteroidaceae bacterium]